MVWRRNPRNAPRRKSVCSEFFDAADITNYGSPSESTPQSFAAARRDGYVLRSETERLHRHWPGSTLRWLTQDISPRW